MAPHTPPPQDRGPAVVRLPGNLPTAASVLVRHAQRGRAALTSAVARALPRSLRPALEGPLARIDPVAALLLAASLRGTEAVVPRLRELAASAGAATAVRAADALVVLHRPEQAAQVLDALPSGTPGLAPVRAAMLADAGQLHRSLELLTGVPGRRARRQRAQLAGDLAALDAARRLHSTGTAHTEAATSPRQAPVRHVLHLTTTALPTAQTGYTIRTQAIATQQLRAGLQVDVASRIGFPVDQGHPAASRRVQVDGVSYHRLLPHGLLPAGAGDRLDLAVELADELVRELRPDLLHAHSKHDNAQVAVAVARRHGLPAIYEVRGFLEETWRSRGGSADSDTYRLSRRAELDCMAAADQVVTLSRSMREHVVAGGIDPAKVHIVPNAVADSFLAGPPERRAARAALGLDDGVRVVGFSGTVNAYEGLDVVVEALKQLDNASVRLLVVGAGPGLAQVRRLAEPLGDRALFTGKVPHARVREHLAAMDLFVVPRRDTPVTRLVPPLKHLEAMATGVAVLLSDLPPLRETAEDCGAALLAAPDDPSAWAGAIGEALADTASLREREETGRAWIRDARCWSRVARRYEVVYEAAMAAR